MLIPLLIRRYGTGLTYGLWYGQLALSAVFCAVAYLGWADAQAADGTEAEKAKITA